MNNEEAKSVERLRGKQAELLAIKRCLNSPDGQIFGKYLLKTFCIGTTFDDNPCRQAFREGQRSVSLMIVGTAFKPDRFAKQISELIANIETQQEE